MKGQKEIIICDIFTYWIFKRAEEAVFLKPVGILSVTMQYFITGQRSLHQHLKSGSEAISQLTPAAIPALTQCADHARIGRLAEIRIQSFRGQFCGSIFPGESRK